MSNWINELVAERPKAAKYIAWVGEVEFMGASESDSTGKRVTLRIIRPPEQLGVVNPFAKFTRRRRGYTGSRFEVGLASVEGSREMLLEFALVNWSDGPRGSSAVFEISSAEVNKHPFMHDQRATKETSGTRYMMTFIEKDEEDALVCQDKVERLEAAKKTGRHQTLSNVARLLTKNQRFRDWLQEVEDDSSEWTIKDADDWLKDTCGIESKSELDDDATPESAAKIMKFHKLRSSFVQWQEAQGFDTHE